MGDNAPEKSRLTPAEHFHKVANRLRTELDAAEAQLAALKAENAKLRAALQKIADTNPRCDTDCAETARAALETP